MKDSDKGESSKSGSRMDKRHSFHSPQAQAVNSAINAATSNGFISEGEEKIVPRRSNRHKLNADYESEGEEKVRLLRSSQKQTNGVVDVIPGEDMITPKTKETRKNQKKKVDTDSNSEKDASLRRSTRRNGKDVDTEDETTPLRRSRRGQGLEEDKPVDGGKVKYSKMSAFAIKRIRKSNGQFEKIMPDSPNTAENNSAGTQNDNTTADEPTSSNSMMCMYNGIVIKEENVSVSRSVSPQPSKTIQNKTTKIEYDTEDTTNEGNDTADESLGPRRSHRRKKEKKDNEFVYYSQQIREVKKEISPESNEESKNIILPLSEPSAEPTPSFSMAHKNGIQIHQEKNESPARALSPSKKEESRSKSINMAASPAKKKERVSSLTPPPSPSNKRVLPTSNSPQERSISPDHSYSHKSRAGRPRKKGAPSKYVLNKISKEKQEEKRSRIIGNGKRTRDDESNSLEDNTVKKQIMQAEGDADDESSENDQDEADSPTELASGIAKRSYAFRANSSKAQERKVEPSSLSEKKNLSNIENGKNKIPLPLLKNRTMEDILAKTAAKKKSLSLDAPEKLAEIASSRDRPSRRSIEFSGKKKDSIDKSRDEEAPSSSQNEHSSLVKFKNKRVDVSIEVDAQRNEEKPFGSQNGYASSSGLTTRSKAKEVEIKIECTFEQDDIAINSENSKTSTAIPDDRPAARPKRISAKLGAEEIAKLLQKPSSKFYSSPQVENGENGNANASISQVTAETESPISSPVTKDKKSSISGLQNAEKQLKSGTEPTVSPSFKVNYSPRSPRRSTRNGIIEIEATKPMKNSLTSTQNNDTKKNKIMSEKDEERNEPKVRERRRKTAAKIFSPYQSPKKTNRKTIVEIRGSSLSPVRNPETTTAISREHSSHVDSPRKSARLERNEKSSEPSGQFVLNGPIQSKTISPKVQDGVCKQKTDKPMTQLDSFQRSHSRSRSLEPIETEELQELSSDAERRLSPLQKIYMQRSNRIKREKLAAEQKERKAFQGSIERDDTTAKKVVASKSLDAEESEENEDEERAKSASPVKAKTKKGKKSKKKAAPVRPSLPARTPSPHSANRPPLFTSPCSRKIGHETPRTKREQDRKTNELAAACVSVFAQLTIDSSTNSPGTSRFIREKGVLKTPDRDETSSVIVETDFSPEGLTLRDIEVSRTHKSTSLFVPFYAKRKLNLLSVASPEKIREKSPKRQIDPSKPVSQGTKSADGLKKKVVRDECAGMTKFSSATDKGQLQISSSPATRIMEINTASLVAIRSKEKQSNKVTNCGSSSPSKEQTSVNERPSTLMSLRSRSDLNTEGEKETPSGSRTRAAAQIGALTDLATTNKSLLAASDLSSSKSAVILARGGLVKINGSNQVIDRQKIDLPMTQSLRQSLDTKQSTKNYDKGNFKGTKRGNTNLLPEAKRIKLDEPVEEQPNTPAIERMTLRTRPPKPPPVVKEKKVSVPKKIKSVIKPEKVELLVNREALIKSQGRQSPQHYIYQMETDLKLYKIKHLFGTRSFLHRSLTYLQRQFSPDLIKNFVVGYDLPPLVHNIRRRRRARKRTVDEKKDNINAIGKMLYTLNMAYRKESADNNDDIVDSNKWMEIETVADLIPMLQPNYQSSLEIALPPIKSVKKNTDISIALKYVNLENPEEYSFSIGCLANAFRFLPPDGASKMYPEVTQRCIQQAKSVIERQIEKYKRKLTKRSEIISKKVEAPVNVMTPSASKDSSPPTIYHDSMSFTTLKHKSLPGSRRCCWTYFYFVFQNNGKFTKPNKLDYFNRFPMWINGQNRTTIDLELDFNEHEKVFLLLVTKILEDEKTVTGHRLRDRSSKIPINEAQKQDVMEKKDDNYPEERSRPVESTLFGVHSLGTKEKGFTVGKLNIGLFSIEELQGKGIQHPDFMEDIIAASKKTNENPFIMAEFKRRTLSQIHDSDSEPESSVGSSKNESQADSQLSRQEQEALDQGKAADLTAKKRIQRYKESNPFRAPHFIDTYTGKYKCDAKGRYVNDKLMVKELTDSKRILTSKQKLNKINELMPLAFPEKIRYRFLLWNDKPEKNLQLKEKREVVRKTRSQRDLARSERKKAARLMEEARLAAPRGVEIKKLRKTSKTLRQEGAVMKKEKKKGEEKKKWSSNKQKTVEKNEPKKEESKEESKKQKMRKYEKTMAIIKRMEEEDKLDDERKVKLAKKKAKTEKKIQKLSAKLQASEGKKQKKKTQLKKKINRMSLRKMEKRGKVMVQKLQKKMMKPLGSIAMKTTQKSLRDLPYLPNKIRAIEIGKLSWISCIQRSADRCIFCNRQFKTVYHLMMHLNLNYPRLTFMFSVRKRSLEDKEPRVFANDLEREQCPEFEENECTLWIDVMLNPYYKEMLEMIPYVKKEPKVKNHPIKRKPCTMILVKKKDVKVLRKSMRMDNTIFARFLNVNDFKNESFNYFTRFWDIATRTPVTFGNRGTTSDVLQIPNPNWMGINQVITRILQEYEDIDQQTINYMCTWNTVCFCIGRYNQNRLGPYMMHRLFLKVFGNHVRTEDFWKDVFITQLVEYMDHGVLSGGQVYDLSMRVNHPNYDPLSDNMSSIYAEMFNLACRRYRTYRNAQIRYKKNPGAIRKKFRKAFKYNPREQSRAYRDQLVRHLYYDKKIINHFDPRRNIMADPLHLLHGDPEQNWKVLRKLEHTFLISPDNI